jgi:acyl carrier protein
VTPFTLEDLKQILVRLNVLGGRVAPDDPDATFEAVGLDSIAFLEIQIEMEQRYGFRVSEEEARQIRTLGQAVEFVNRRLDQTET